MTWYERGWRDGIHRRPRNANAPGLFVSAYENGYNDALRALEREKN